MKKYRIRAKFYNLPPGSNNISMIGYDVQMKVWPWVWVTVKSFRDDSDPMFAKREASELLDKLNER